LQPTADARRIDGDRFLGEDVFARLDRRFEVDWPEAGRSGQDDEIRATFQRLLVGIEADELAILRHVHATVLEERIVVAIATRDLLLDLIQAQFHAIGKGVGDRPQLDRARGGEGLRCRSGAPSAGADERDFDLVAAAELGRVGDAGIGAEHRPAHRQR
jgi:hypothetical protein